MAQQFRINIPAMELLLTSEPLEGSHPEPTPTPEPPPEPEPTPEPEPEPTPPPQPEPEPTPNPVPPPVPVPGGQVVQVTPDNIHEELAKPHTGDVLVLSPGVYKGLDERRDGNYSFVSQLEGATLVAYPGEGVKLTGPLSVLGSNSRYIGIEIADDDSNHYDSRGGSWAFRESDSGWAWNVSGNHNQIINCAAIDCAGGILCTNGHGIHTYGNLLLCNGWVSTDRTHGHGGYTQNPGRTSVVHDTNVCIRNFGRGWQFYGVNAILEDMVLKNTAFLRDNFVFSGAANSKRISVLNNWLYHKPKSRPTTGHYGQPQAEYSKATKNEDSIIRGNFFGGGVALAWMVRGIFARNVAVGAANTAINPVKIYQNPETQKVQPNRGNHTFAGNTYYGGSGKCIGVIDYPNTSGPTYSLEQWRALGYDLDSAAYDGKPKNQTHVYANRYEDGRGHICVANYEEKDTTFVDIDNADDGEVLTIFNADDPYGTTVRRTVVGGRVNVPLTGWGSHKFNNYDNLVGRFGLEYFEDYDLDASSRSDAVVLVYMKAARSRADLLLDGV